MGTAAAVAEWFMRKPLRIGLLLAVLLVAVLLVVVVLVVLVKVLRPARMHYNLNPGGLSCPSALPVRVDPKVMVSAGKLKSKKVAMRVTCEGFKGVVPRKVSRRQVATVSDSQCNVDLRIEIWKLTF